MTQHDEVATTALESAWEGGVPALATALYARWWQLESWLRELLYVELQAKHGGEWHELIVRATERHWNSDRKYSYMDTPDASSRLAYIDVGKLLEVIEDQWDVVGYALLGDLSVWNARMSELNKIRRRIAHCRRPHADDLSRVEQILRDIDADAHRAVSSFNHPSWFWGPPDDHPDPLFQALRGDGFPHLRKHCERNYGIEFRLHYSRRPWASRPPSDGIITGLPGYIWHATWHLTQGPGDARRLWEELSTAHHDLLIFLVADPFSFEVTFSALHDPVVIAEAITVMFDRVVSSRRPPLGLREPGRLGDDGGWRDLHRDLDWRVQIGSAWNVVDAESPVSLFSV